MCVQCIPSMERMKPRRTGFPMNYNYKQGPLSNGAANETVGRCSGQNDNPEVTS